MLAWYRCPVPRQYRWTTSSQVTFWSRADGRPCLCQHYASTSPVLQILLRYWRGTKLVVNFHLDVETGKTAQYWPNLGSQESAIVIGPKSPFASVKCWADNGGLCRLFKFTDLQPKLGSVSALYQADCHISYAIPDLSFQQWHDIDNRSLATFLPTLGQCWAISNFALGLPTYTRI